MRRLVSGSLFVALLLWPGMPAAHAQAVASSPTDGQVPAAAQAAYQQAMEAQGRNQLDVALADLQLAAKQAGTCPECLAAMVSVQQAMGDDRAALATANRMAEAASASPGKARAEMLTSRIEYGQYFAYTDGTGAYQKNPKRAGEALRRAESAMSRAVQLDPANERMCLLEGHLLATLHRDADAGNTFRTCAGLPGLSAAETRRALHYASDAELARHEPAPMFEATSLDGSRVSLDNLAGKVVLIDFWGTWCRYCQRDTDYVQSLEDSFGKDRFVLLEVNSGDSHDRWTQYVHDEHLEGIQVQDQGSRLQSLFRVGIFPTYIVLDGEGTERMRVGGAQGDLRSEIRDLLNEGSAGTRTDVASSHP